MTAPMTDPDRDTQDRTITASWLVGEPDAEGWQARADLTVTHEKGDGYYARLSTLHQRGRGRPATALRTLNPDPKRCSIPIHDHPAARFNRKTLAGVYNTALRELRARFEADDQTLTTFFDPESPVYFYPGAPTHHTATPSR